MNGTYKVTLTITGLQVDTMQLCIACFYVIHQHVLYCKRSLRDTLQLAMFCVNSLCQRLASSSLYAFVTLQTCPIYPVSVCHVRHYLGLCDCGNDDTLLSLFVCANCTCKHVIPISWSLMIDSSSGSGTMRANDPTQPPAATRMLSCKTIHRIQRITSLSLKYMNIPEDTDISYQSTQEINLYLIDNTFL